MRPSKFWFRTVIEIRRKNVLVSSKKRATGVRILLFGLRYFGREISILSPHLQLTASGPIDLKTFEDEVLIESGVNVLTRHFSFKFPIGTF